MWRKEIALPRLARRVTFRVRGGAKLEQSYVFKIEGFTPQTMPFGRLVEYYSELRKLIRADAFHLVNVETSSHGSVFRIDESFLKVVNEDFQAIRQGTAPMPRRRAVSTINQMLRDDRTSAALVEQDGGAEIVAFPGMSAPVSLRTYGDAEFTGEVYHIARGKQSPNVASVRIDTTDGVVFCKAPVELAKSLSNFLFDDVKVQGKGAWERSAIGEWSIRDFEITDFRPVKREKLRDAINDVRALDIQWPAEPLAALWELREDAD